MTNDKEYLKEWRKNNPEKNTAYYRNKIKEKIYKLLGNKCANPYNLDHGDFVGAYASLQIDHVNGGGNKERKNNYSNYYRIILKKIQEGSKEYQLLCTNCNWIKMIKNKEWEGQK